MTHLWVLISGFLFANLMCLIAIWNNYSYNCLEPKYVGSSYDPNRKEELDSFLLKSVEKYIKKFFNIKTTLEESLRRDLRENSTIFLGESLEKNETFSLKKKIQNYQSIKNSESSKFSMFLDRDKENVIILKISNEGNKLNKYDSKTGEVILYSIPVENFVPKKETKKENFNYYNFSAKQNYLENTLIKECWSSKFFGRIIGAVASSDKKKLCIFYRVVKGHTITYRIRYFHDISCGNGSIERTDNIMIENFGFYMDTRLGNDKRKTASSYIENYFEISEENNNQKQNVDGNSFNDAKQEKENIFKNYFDDNSYDDFLLKGNTPITAMAIKEDVIAYARDLDYRQYYILKREKKTYLKDEMSDKFNSFANNQKNLTTEKKETHDMQEKIIWKVSSLGPKIDRKIQPFFHTNSLKFMDDPHNNYRLIHIFVSLNTSDVSSYGYFRISNHTDFNENFTELTFTSIPFFKVLFINEILESNEEFNLEKSIKKLKKYLQPTLFSNNFNSQEMIFEFTKSYLLLMHSNSTTGNVHFIRMRPDAKEKISKIHSDLENENIIIKYEGKKDMIYLLKEKLILSENFEDPNSFTEYSKSISMKNIPKYYRNKEPLTYLMEKINEKYVMIILNEDGILLSLDISEVRSRIIGKGWMGLLFSNLNSSTTIMMLINLSTLLLYFHYSNTRINRIGNITRRQGEINSVLQEIIRLNNRNLIYNAAIQNTNQNSENAENDNNNNPGDIEVRNEPAVENVNEGEDNNAEANNRAMNENDININDYIVDNYNIENDISNQNNDLPNENVSNNNGNLLIQRVGRDEMLNNLRFELNENLNNILNQLNNNRFNNNLITDIREDENVNSIGNIGENTENLLNEHNNQSVNEEN